MHFFSSARTACRYRILIISALLQLTRSVDCFNNQMLPADSNIVGIYKKFPAFCDEEYRLKYISSNHQKATVAGPDFVSETPYPDEIDEKSRKERHHSADPGEVLKFDYDSEFLPVEKDHPEFLIHDKDGSTEFPDYRDESTEFGVNFASFVWNVTDKGEVHDLEDDKVSQRRVLRSGRGEEIGKIKRYMILPTQVTAGEEPESFRKKLDSFFRYRKSNRKFNLEEEMSAKPYTMMDTFRSIFDSRRDASGILRANLRQAAWSEDNCKSLRRIVGGYIVESSEELPYMVFVDTGCGGAILNDRWVLTAGHCMVHDEPQYVHTGSLDLLAGCQYNVVHVFVHPKFNRENLQYDIGLLKISPSFVFSPAIKPIRMSESKVRRKTCGLVAGWGAETYKGGPKYKLTMTMIPVVGRKKCRMFGIKEGQFCAGYQDASSDACQGDSGGPFVINGILVGIVSFGYKCATPNIPAVYVDVSYHREWIRTVAGI